MPVSRILFPFTGRLSFICSGNCSPESICLPFSPAIQQRTGRPQGLIYMAFLHTRFTPLPHYCCNAWALTPRFHPYLPTASAVIFCGTFCWLTPPGYSPVCCPAQSGLSSPVHGSDSPAYSIYKFTGCTEKRFRLHRNQKKDDTD